MAVSSTEFILQPLVDILTRERLSSARLQVSIASIYSYGKIKSKIQNSEFFLVPDFSWSHTPPPPPREAGYSTAF